MSKLVVVLSCFFQHKISVLENLENVNR